MSPLRTFRLSGLWFALCMVILSVRPAAASSLERADKAQAKNDVEMVATAVTAYETEYGRLPGRNTGMVGGKILAALLGEKGALNPKGIVFLEIGPAKKGRSGLLNGVFLDPWGAPYLIVYGPNAEGKVIAGTNHVEIRKKVGVWNDPSRHDDAAKLTDAQKRRRYVTSWE